MKWLLFFVIVAIFLSGCTQQEMASQVYINAYASPQMPRYGDNVRVKIELKNMLEKIENVYIRIENLDLLTFQSIEKCSGKAIEKGCYADYLEKGDEMSALFLFKVPSLNMSYQNDKITPSFLISYDYSSGYLVKVPILGEKYYGSRKISATSSSGPISARISGIPDRVMSGDIFTIEIELTDANNGDVVIKKNDASLQINGFTVNGNCDFEGGSVLIPKNDIKLSPNSILRCDLKANNVNANSWFDGTIKLDYKYNYNIKNQVEINIKT